MTGTPDPSALYSNVSVSFAGALALAVLATPIGATTAEWSKDRVYLSGASPIAHAAWSNETVRDEYLRLADGDLSGELVYIAANARDMFVIDPVDVEQSIGEFAHTRSAAMLGAEHRLDGALGPIFWRAFTLPVRDEHCAGFTATGNDDAEDPDNRPTAIAFGYVCRSGSLDRAAVDRFLGSLELSSLPRDQSAADGLAKVAGMTADDVRASVPAWPFDVASRYMISGS